MRKIEKNPRKPRENRESAASPSSSFNGLQMAYFEAFYKEKAANKRLLGNRRTVNASCPSPKVRTKTLEKKKVRTE
ncbi:MAG: hypothetical protein LBT01_06085 [Spirochaetaceae bacterium]|jgi:hypothetical protein|nr:hypothetical protein [Spirochaetaceae bacterium]